MMIAGTAYLLLLKNFSAAPQPKHLIKFIVIFGALLRILWVGSTPIYEDDYYRYFFDGQLTTKSLNPYAHAPSDALPSPFPASIEDGLDSTQTSDTDLSFEEKTLRSIADNGPVERVAYPYIRTIYPPVAQAFFALSQTLDSWGLDTWRLILFTVDGISLWLLFKLLSITRMPQRYAAIYWLNPLLITETMNAGHMDGLMLPFLISAAIFTFKARPSFAGLMLAGAVGVKFWPVLLSPIIFSTYLKKPKQLLRAACPFAITSLLIIAPQVFTKLDSDAGLITYSENWHVNAFLFSVLFNTLSTIIEDPSLLARGCIALIILATALYQMRQALKAPVTQNTDKTLSSALLVVTATLFLLSPTGYPWYFIWLLPWLSLHPSPALLLLTVTLPLYDIRYPLSLSENGQNMFDQIIVPLEFAPTIIWLAIQYGRKRVLRKQPA